MARKKQAVAAVDSPAETPDTSMTLQESLAAGPEPAPTVEAPEDGERKFVDTIGQGHRVDLGDGRWLRFSRSARWQQARIEFIAKNDDVDPKPKAEDGDTKWLREKGYQWRSSEKAWSKQLERNSDDNIYARANSHGAAHAEFLELANRIRERNGLEPLADIGQERVPF